MTAWVLPDHLADVLPSEARHIEELRRKLLDVARGYGYELVIPPLLEHLDSLLTGTGEALDLQTFKLVDQLSGRSLGLRADTTPQAARIDAQLLNRQGVARLCYCGPVLHTRPSNARSSREPLQLGCELFGHDGIEAELEVLHLAIDCLQRAGVGPLVVDLADASVVRAQLAGLMVSPDSLRQIHEALAKKDRAKLSELTQSLPEPVQRAVLGLTQLHGGVEVLSEAKNHLLYPESLGSLLSKIKHLAGAMPSNVQVQVDLADARGWGYYSGLRFAIYSAKGHGPLARGGRYDEVGAVFGRNRAAVGFSLDLKELAAVAQPAPVKAAICAPWSAANDPDLTLAIARLRAAGETVVCVLPGHDHASNETQEFACDRELFNANGVWAIRSLT
jgi:ATP phosphoribosyltransferase regulatory subunit